MNKNKIIEQIKSGRHSLFTQTMIFHNMQEIVEQQTWMHLKNYLHYEELLKAGIIEEQYVSFMRNQNVAVISYCVGDKQDLVGAFQQMEALKEIYSSIPIRIAIQADEFNTEEVPSCYRFIKGVEIACFSKDCQDEMLDWLTRSESLYISFPTFRFNTSFYRKESFYLEFQKNMNWDQHPFEKKIYFGGFFRSLLVSKELYHSIMSGYDFVEFMLSTVHY